VRVASSLRFLPAGLFGAVMGLAGLGLASRAAAAQLPFFARFSELWVGLAVLALLALLPAYALKALRYPAAVREELSNPALLGFCAALPVGMSLAAAGVEPYSEALARLLWWICAPLFLVLQAWTLVLLARRRVKLAQVNGGMLIVLVGGIVMPFAGLPLGYAGMSAAMFCASAFFAVFLMAALLYRLAAGPVLPEALRPSWLIMLVPPSLIYLNGDSLWPGRGGAALEWLFYSALALAALLIYLGRGFRRWPFGAPWWAFTFPLDALAGAAVRFATVHPDGPWTPLAGGLLLLATAAVLMVLVRTLAALARGTLLAAPAK
jgi:tellurite resistance protein